MAESRSVATIAWLWIIEYLETLEDFDSSLLDELIEFAPDDVRKAADELFQSPLPTKCSLELIREQLVGGLISDDVLKKRSRIFTEGVNSVGSEVAGLLQSERNSLTKENNGECILNEICGEQLNRQPNHHSVRTGDGDLNVQTAESIKDDGVLLETVDANAGGDLNLQGTESIEVGEEEEEEDVVLMEIPDSYSPDEVQNNNQPSTAGTRHAVETGGVDANLQGTEPTPDDDDDDMVPSDAPVANANGGLNTSHQQPSTGGTEHIVKTSRTNRDGQQPSTAKLDHPYENGGHTNNKQAKPGRNKETESNRDHHPAKSSNGNGEERDSRKKRTTNDFVEARQPSVPADASESNLCGRCHRPGALLECNSVNCIMMIHRDCLGYDANSSEEEGRRDFYCPFCAHIRAVAELHKAQRRVALTQKNLTAFVDLSIRSLVNKS